MAKKIILADYISSLQDNWGTKSFNYNISNNIDNIVEGKSNDNMIERQKRDLENNNNINN